MRFLFDKVSYEISYEGDGRGVILTWTGVVSMPDFLAVRHKLFGEGPVPALRYHIVDLSKATSTDASLDDIQSLAMRDRGIYLQNPNLVMAIVQSQFLEHEDLYKIFAQVWSGVREIETFLTIGAAREWIADKVKLNDSK